MDAKAEAAPTGLEFVRGSIKRKKATGIFEELLKADPAIRGHVFYGYPLFQRAKDGRTAPDAVIVSHTGQVIAIHMTEELELPATYRELQDECAMAVDRKLRLQKGLYKNRQLRVTTQTLTFGLHLETDNSDGMYPILNRNSLMPALREYAGVIPDGVDYQQVLDAVMYTNTDLGIW